MLECLILIIRIGDDCSSKSPRERMDWDVDVVTRESVKIRESLKFVHVNNAKFNKSLFFSSFCGEEEREGGIDFFAGQFDLQNFVKITMPERAMEILDQSLLSSIEGIEHGMKQGMMHECLASILRICINCSSNDSNECLKRE